MKECCKKNTKVGEICIYCYGLRVSKTEVKEHKHRYKRYNCDCNECNADHRACVCGAEK